jgi:hypothetical protein
VDQLSFEFLDPAAFERVREQGGLAVVRESWFAGRTGDRNHPGVTI